MGNGDVEFGGARPATVDVDGRRVAYLRAGDGGCPLLLVHGFTGVKEDFLPVLGGLARARPVVAVDLPGHGGSAPLDDPGAYSLPALALWVLRIADALGLREFHLLGYSMGGLVAQRVAALASQRLESLILASTGLGAVREEVADYLGQVATAAREQGLAAAYAIVHGAPRQRPSAPADPAREAYLRRRFLSFHPEVIVAGARNLVTAMPLGAFLRGIDIPVLVVHGEHDDIWLSSEQALLASTITAARRVVVPDSAHAPQQERPEVWLDAVTAFLDEAERKDARRLSDGPSVPAL